MTAATGSAAIKTATRKSASMKTAGRKAAAGSAAIPREMLPYTRRPPAMPVGASGKRGYLRMGFELDARGRTVLRDLERRVPYIVQQALYFDEAWPDLPCVYILSSSGSQVDGDRYEQRIALAEGASAHISTGAATKLASMRYNHTAWRQRFDLAAGSYLEYLPEPVIPCRHTRLHGETTLCVDPTATAVYAEIFSCGRRSSGERFCFDILSVANEALRPSGERLFREKFVIRPGEHSPETLGAMNGYDLLGSVILLAPPEVADAVYGQTASRIDPARHTAAGVSRLPRRAGLIYKVLGRDTATVKESVRAFCSTVRLAAKGRPLPAEFPWR